MSLFLKRNEFSPAQLAKVLSDEFGHKVTAAVIRKWDDEIYDGMSRTRGNSETRAYSQAEVYIFNAIAVLRNMGYGIEEVKTMLAGMAHSMHSLPGKAGHPDMVIDMGKDKIILEIKGRIDKQRLAFDVVEKYIDMALKKE